MARLIGLVRRWRCGVKWRDTAPIRPYKGLIPIRREPREPMIFPDRTAQVLRSGVTVATLLAWAVGCCGAALAQSSRSPAKTQNTVKQHDQELNSVRDEQRKSLETEQRLTTENSAIAEERRRLNQSLIASASRIRAAEERVAAMEARLRELDGNEANIRQSLEGRRSQIAEILAALQR